MRGFSKGFPMLSFMHPRNLREVLERLPETYDIQNKPKEINRCVKIRREVGDHIKQGRALSYSTGGVSYLITFIETHQALSISFAVINVMNIIREVLEHCLAG